MIISIKHGGVFHITKQPYAQGGMFMKRIQQACICQTLHFFVKEDFPRAQAGAQVAYEVQHYKDDLEKNHVAYKILEEKTLDDGSVVLKLIKQYNHSPVGDYLD